MNKPEAHINETLLDLPYNESLGFRVKITVNPYGFHPGFPDGGKFVTIESGGGCVTVEYRHLYQVIDALLKAGTILNSDQDEST